MEYFLPSTRPTSEHNRYTFQHKISIAYQPDADGEYLSLGNRVKGSQTFPVGL